MTKEEKKEYKAKWYQKNRDKILDRQKAYYVEHKEERDEYHKKWCQNHKEELFEYKSEYQDEYRKTPMGRAHCINSSYNQNDIKYNRGKCTLTARWIVDNIFPMPCHYCGAMGWEIMGCDRIDNSLPHTPDNVVPCCEECNKKRGSMSYEAFVSMLK